MTTQKAIKKNKKMEIKSYKGQKANFYIQVKGLHSGRPLKKPITNCVAVNTNIENAFEIIYCLWKAKAFRNYIGGSVVPFIRLSDLKKIIKNALLNYTFSEDKLKAIQLIDENIEILKKKINLLIELQETMARQLIKRN